MDEKRLSMRAMYACPVTITEIGNGRKREANTRDIGTGGFGISLADEVKPDTKVIVELHLRKNTQPICCEGTITWVSMILGNESRASIYMAGIRFDNISAWDLQVIGNFVIVLASKNVLEVAHDMRAALAAISMTLDAVLSGRTGPLGDKTKDMIARAARRSEGLLSFVEKLQDLSKIRTSGVAEKEELDLEEIILRILDNLKEQTTAKSLSVDVEIADGLPPLKANRDTLMNALSNVIHNAIKYTPEKQKIGIQACLNEGMFEITVWDTGMGIPKDDLPHVFDDFFRAQNAESSHIEGTGLGLSIVKQIATEHGGDVKVESEENKGAKFILEFPAKS